MRREREKVFSILDGVEPDERHLVDLAGGKGSPLYSVLGVLILAILDNGLIILNISTYWQLVVSGLILLFAVTLDSVKNMQAAKKY